jgi:hypothetical protein
MNQQQSEGKGKLFEIEVDVAFFFLDFSSNPQ